MIEAGENSPLQGQPNSEDDTGEPGGHPEHRADQFIGLLSLRTLLVSDPNASVREMMITDPITLSPAQTLGEVSDEVLWRSRHTAYPVVRDGVAVGLFPATALEGVARRHWADERVADHMEPLAAVPAVGPDDELPAAVAALQRTRLQRALVLDGERLVGLLTAGDVARALGITGEDAVPV